MELRGGVNRFPGSPGPRYFESFPVGLCVNQTFWTTDRQAAANAHGRRADCVAGPGQTLSVCEPLRDPHRHLTRRYERI